uniref:Negative elongation factor complex member A n=1 Tax=Capra hircus TaxID=9925 RepID=A0A452F4B2_CAPHI
MASMRESDTGLWLHNKLGATDELWAPPSIASLLTAAVIDNIRLCFHGLSSAVKLKLLLGTLHLPRRTVDEVRRSVTQLCPTFWTPCAAGQASLSLPVSQSLLRLIQPSPPLSSPSPSAFNPSQHQGLFQ